MDIETWENQIRKTNLFKLVNEGEMSLKNDKTHTPEQVEAHIKHKYAL